MSSSFNSSASSHIAVSSSIRYDKIMQLCHSYVLHTLICSNNIPILVINTKTIVGRILNVSAR